MNISGFEIICLQEVGSTNDVANIYAQKAAGQKLVIAAKRQTAGRGRRGRSWQSLDGNLFFSILLEFALKDLGKLIMAASLSLLLTIKQYDKKADVVLKWPNDVLLNGAKVSGILLEKGEGEYMIAGIGVNIKQSPQGVDMLYPTTSLKAAGIETTPDEFLQKYLPEFSANLKLTSEELRRKWLNNAKGIGAEIAVRQNGKEQKGIFKGIDENADLLLKTEKGTEKILAGDVFYVGEENG